MERLRNAWLCGPASNTRIPQVSVAWVKPTSRRGEFQILVILRIAALPHILQRLHPLRCCHNKIQDLLATRHRHEAVELRPEYDFAILMTRPVGWVSAARPIDFLSAIDECRSEAGQESGSPRPITNVIRGEGRESTPCLQAAAPRAWMVGPRAGLRPDPWADHDGGAGTNTCPASALTHSKAAGQRSRAVSSSGAGPGSVANLVAVR
jgi:hypothetical protein